MCRDKDLWLDGFCHSAHVIVDEAGTEAAAVTYSEIRTGRARPLVPIEMIVDRPFLFFILDGPTKTVLFAGRVLQP